MIENTDELSTTPQREIAIQCIEGAINAVHPRTVIPEKLNLKSETLCVSGKPYDLIEYDEIFVIGGGNVAGQVALELEKLLEDHLTTGVIVTDATVSTDTIEVIEAAYPVPDERGMAGTRKILDITNKAGDEDLILTVISGGGSPLLPAPVADISLGDLQTTTKLLYEHGLDMKEVNTVRKHISATKGGRLAEAASPATTVSLVFSDIVGNDIASVASGPTFPDTTTFADAISIVDRYDIDLPERVHSYLERGYRGTVEETPDKTNPVFENVYHHVLADGFSALSGAKDVAEDHGYAAKILWSHTRGDATELAKPQIGIAQEILKSGHPVEPPAVILTGGDMTGSKDRDSPTGPNQAFALSAALECQKEELTDIALASIATEGLDGLSESGPAGALVDETTAVPKNEAWQALEDGRAFGFLRSKNDLVFTGVTGTNVNDIHVLVVSDQST